jgi:hypothetical protein
VEDEGAMASTDDPHHLASLAVIVVAVVALSILHPEALWIIAIFVNQLFVNTTPPPIAENTLVGANWGNRVEVNQKLAAVIQRNFPAGTNEDSLKSVLASQGFKPLPPPPADCIPPGQVQPVGRVFTTCPTNDRSRMLEYNWSNFPCGSTVTVSWTSDDRNKITHLDSSYYMACL